MIRVLIVVAVLAMVGATPASAYPVFRIVNEAGQPMGGRWQRWADAVPAPVAKDVVVSFSNPRGLRVPAYTSPGAPVYVTGVGDVGRFDFVHELGHHVDYVMPEATRAFVMRHVLWRSGAWRQDGGGSPHEQFAEAVAVALVSADDVGFSLEIGPRRARLLHRVLLSPTSNARLLDGLLGAARRRWALGG